MGQPFKAVELLQGALDCLDRPAVQLAAGQGKYDIEDARRRVMAAMSLLQDLRKLVSSGRPTWPSKERLVEEIKENL